MDRNMACCAPQDAPAGTIREQFGNPRGLFGWVVGHLMAFKNRERSLWVLDRLDPQPADHVLEIGFGPGSDVQRLATRFPAIRISGIDHSTEMLRHASRRNAAAIHAGRIDLRAGDAAELPFADASCNRAFSINSVQFWRERAVVLDEIRRVLVPGGRLVIAIQPRERCATDETARQWAARLSAELQSAGFFAVQAKTEKTSPVATACVTGTR